MLFVIRTLTAALAMIVAPLLAAGEIIEGRVTAGNAPLPGCTVTLASSSESRVTVSNAEGRYSFRYVAAGSYEVRFDLAGMQTRAERVEVRGHTIVPDVELSPSDPSTVTVTCTLGATCTDYAPKSRWDLPSCIDQQSNDALIEAIARGDVSAIPLLQRRYETTETYLERHRLAAVLLGKVQDDRAIWNDLIENAAICVRFPRVNGQFSREFEDYCRERNLDPARLWYMSWRALSNAARDPRARPLLLEALKTSDLDLITVTSRQ